MQPMLKNINFLLLFLFVAFGVQAQNYTLSGSLKDASTGEDLIYATVAVQSLNKGVNTNLYGFYSLTLPAGTYEVTYSFIGLEKQVFTIDLNQDVEKNVELGAASQEIVYVVVTAEKDNENVSNTEVSVVTIDVQKTKKIPVLLGEQNIIQTLQLMPGISSNGEGGTGFFVRGGNVDQNLILLDEAPVYNASHLLGFFSVFNSDALKDVKLYKGGIPAEYGGRASSVMDIRMKEGNLKEWGATGGIGLISSRLTVEGPFQKDKGSIIVSGRRTYADVVAKTFSDQFDGLDLFFYDFNAKANYKIGSKDRIFVSGYLGRDKFGFEGFGFDWGNTTLTTRWNHTFNQKLFSNTTFIYSDYNYGFDISFGDNGVNLSAGIFDYNLKQDYSFFLNPNNTIRFGWQAILHDFKPNSFSFNGDDPESAAQRQQALENGIYVSNEQKVGNRINLNYGLRVSNFNNVGDYTEEILDDDRNVIESIYREAGTIYNSFVGFEPRANATFLLNEKSSFKASYNRNFQYLHLLSNSNAGTPTDLWIPSSPAVTPTMADQIAIGYFRNFRDNSYKFSVEGYYKWLQNTVDYKDGAETFGVANIEREVVQGDGRAFGVEFLLQKTKGKFTGWLSYTLSRAELQNDAINGGNWYSARQNRPHDVSIVGIYDISPRWNVSATWVYSSGLAVTYPVGKYEINGELINQYSVRNGDKLPDYHRLDIGATYIISKSDRFSNELNLSFYNAYNRMNAFSITFEENAQGQTQATRLALFGIIPALTWNFTF